MCISVQRCKQNAAISGRFVVGLSRLPLLQRIAARAVRAARAALCIRPQGTYTNMKNNTICI